MGLIDPFRYAALYADVHSRIGRLLSPSLLSNLLLVSSLDDFIKSLEETHYREAIDSLKGRIETTHIELDQLERALRGHMARATHSLLTFTKGKARDLLQWRWKRFELNNIKTVLRSVQRNVDINEARNSLVPLGNTSKLPWFSLLESSSVPEVIEQLRGTFFGDVVSTALDRYQEQEHLLVIEVWLDLAYFRNLLKLIRILRGRDQKEAERFLGVMIDGQSILWAFRYRIYYNLTPEEILNYSLLDGINADFSTIQSIAMGASIQEVVRDTWGRRLPGTERLNGLSDRQALPELERIMNRYQFSQANEVKKSYTMNLGIALGFDILIQAEVRDLITIAEGKAVGLSPAKIRPYIITPLEL